MQNQSFNIDNEGPGRRNTQDFERSGPYGDHAQNISRSITDRKIVEASEQHLLTKQQNE